MSEQQSDRFGGAGVVLRALSPSAAGLALALAALTASAQVSVSNSGLPNFSQAIAVPPGISGMEPKLGLLYVGGGVNGPVGHGWSVQGLSMITRCSATRYTDGTPRGVRFDVNDKLCLDGQRLIQIDANGVAPAFPQISDASGLASGIREYRTEKDSFARIRAYGVANGNAANGPAYFKVWTKAGQIYEYGAAPSADANTKALINAQGKNVAMVWAVARVSDVTNNYIDFKYEVRTVAWGSGSSTTNPLPGLEWNIQEIQYTGNSAVPQAPTNKVIFRYSDRTQDRSEAYQAGSKSVSVRRLDAIDSYVNSANSTVLGEAAGATLVRRVRLTYGSGPLTKRSRVVSIKECADISETKCQPPTRFTYSDSSGTGNSGVFTDRSGLNLANVDLLGTNGNAGALVGDFNGDGRSDLLYWSDTPSQNKLYLSSGGGAFSNASVLTTTPLQGSNGCYTSTVADFNGDGVADILRVMKAKSTSGASCGTVTNLLLLAASNGSGSFAPITLPSNINLETVNADTTSSNGQTSRSQGRNYYLMDFNSDGLLDIVTTVMPAFSNTPTPPTEIALCATQICTRLYKSNGDGTFTELTGSNIANRSMYLRAISSTLSQRPSVSDLNGDGIADLDVGSGTWLSRGDAAGNFDQGSVGTQSTTGCSLPIDFNSDGRTDCLGVNEATVRPALRLGDGTGNGPWVPSFNVTQTTLVLYTGGGLQYAGVDIADFNGDGRQDFLQWIDLAFSTDPPNKLWLSQGDGAFVEATFSLSNTVLERNSSPSVGVSKHLLGDFSGSGSVEILLLSKPVLGGTTYVSNKLYVKQDLTPPDLLNSVAAPSGLVTYFTYGLPTDAAAGRYTSDRTDDSNKARYPLLDLTIGSPIVVTMETDVGVGTNRIKTEYAYKGLKAAADGRGVLGFRQTLQNGKAPNGEDLTTSTTYLLQEPYAGVARLTETRRGAWNAPSAPLLSRTTNTYCDRTATVSATNAAPVDPDTASDTAPCAFVGKITRPYLRKSVEEGWDLDGTPLPVVTTKNTYTDYGDPATITVDTTATVAGLSGQAYSKRTDNTYCAPDSANCPNKIAGDNWILGRVTRSTVANTVPNLLNNITAGAGSSPASLYTSGSQLAGPPMSPSTLNIVRMLLLND